ncbi:P3 [Avon-Heathcote estuary associated bacilladnavirus]|uniref:P3 n=1 Tax=Avon-Heathcote Estuary associated kieseladnavirus TaxID=3052270 RepID=A0A1P8YT84_AHEBV|nr:P3 [Avon-Heathcote estuary associated bacilladnavirus]AQA27294.1 P3 [Avon-Heathcote estuary associated bacilladnavirus]
MFRVRLIWYDCFFKTTTEELINSKCAELQAWIPPLFVLLRSMSFLTLVIAMFMSTTSFVCSTFSLMAEALPLNKPICIGMLFTSTTTTESCREWSASHCLELIVNSTFCLPLLSCLTTILIHQPSLRAFALSGARRCCLTLILLPIRSSLILLETSLILTLSLMNAFWRLSTASSVMLVVMWDKMISLMPRTELTHCFRVRDKTMKWLCDTFNDDFMFAARAFKHKLGRKYVKRR